MKKRKAAGTVGGFLEGKKKGSEYSVRMVTIGGVLFLVKRSVGGGGE
jgi:hypothetical protein